MMRETGTQIWHNPSSNAKLGNGIARVPEMLAAGINVGLGHDAAESTNNCDMSEELFRFLVHAQQSFVPLEKLFFGTDYPGFLYDPVELRAKLLSVNTHAERVGAAPISPVKLDGILGDNFARTLGRPG